MPLLLCIVQPSGVPASCLAVLRPKGSLLLLLGLVHPSHVHASSLAVLYPASGMLAQTLQPFPLRTLVAALATANLSCCTTDCTLCPVSFRLGAHLMCKSLFCLWSASLLPTSVTVMLKVHRQCLHGPVPLPVPRVQHIGSRGHRQIHSGLPLQPVCL